mgnify:CR=1 FL=1
MPEVRNNTRCIWDSEEEADRLWQKIKSHIPEVWQGHKVICLNERYVYLCLVYYHFCTLSFYNNVNVIFNRFYYI